MGSPEIGIAHFLKKDEKLLTCTQRIRLYYQHKS